MKNSGYRWNTLSLIVGMKIYSSGSVVLQFIEIESSSKPGSVIPRSQYKNWQYAMVLYVSFRLIP